MTRYLFGFLCVCALGVMPLVGCSETTGDGGSGGAAGDGGSGGTGGTGGMPECQNPEDCDDGEECTTDTCASGVCENTAVEDGTVCGTGAGTCQSGSCVGAFACNEAGIRAAISVGGGPHTFQCNGPTTVTTTAEIEIDNDVVLDGEGNLTVDGNDDHRVFSAKADVSAQLWGFTITRGNFEGGSGLLNNGTLTLKNVVVSENQLGGGIWNGGTLTIEDSTISSNQIQMTCGSYCFVGGAGIHNERTLSLKNTTVSENMAVAGDGGGVFNAFELTIVNSLVSENTTMGGRGGGIANRYGTMTIADSTVSANVAELGEAGGIFNGSGSSMTITNTSVSGNSGFAAGGIANRQELLISHSVVSGNNSRGLGGGIVNDYEGELTLLDSRIVDNAAENSGGGIANRGYEPLFASVTLTNSTVAGNTAEFGGGISNDFRNATTTLESSTISGNSATNGGGIFNTGTLTATNSTVSGNTATELGGGIMFRKGSGGSATFTNSTIADNDAPEGSGVDHHSPLATLTVRGSLLEGSCSIGSNATFTSNGYNIESPDNTCGFDQPTDLFDVTAEELNLGELADNGGPTQTHALLTEPTISVAIDRISEAECIDADGVPLTTDQRGEERPVAILGAELKCDVGAFERQTDDP